MENVSVVKVSGGKLMPFFQRLRRTTCAAEFNNYTLQGPNITGRGRLEKTYSLPTEGQEKLEGPIGCRAVAELLTSQEEDSLRRPIVCRPRGQEKLQVPIGSLRITQGRELT